MKFDIVVGNPPYQKGDNSHFYKKFIDKSKKMSDIVALVVPSSYFGNKSSFTGLTHYHYNGMNFANIELSTSWFIWNRDHTGSCRVIINNSCINVEKFAIAPTDDVMMFNIVNKMLLNGITGYDVKSGDLWRKDAIIDNNGIWCVWTCGRLGEDLDKIKISNTQRESLSGFGEHKVVFTEITGHNTLGHAKYADQRHGIARGSRYITVSSMEEANNLINYFKSKFIRAISTVIKGTSKHNTKMVFNSIPKLDTRVPLTDNEIYNAVGLSTIEISYIDSKF